MSPTVLLVNAVIHKPEPAANALAWIAETVELANAVLMESAKHVRAVWYLTIVPLVLVVLRARVRHVANVKIGLTVAQVVVV